MMEWEPWKPYPENFPNVGDYVQSHGISWDTGNPETAEGIVAASDPPYGFNIAGTTTKRQCIRWRRGILPEKDKKVRKKEKVA